MSAFKQEEQQNPHIITLLDSLETKLRRAGQLQAGLQLGTISVDEIRELVRLTDRVDVDYQKARVLMESQEYKKQLPIGAPRVLEMYKSLAVKADKLTEWQTVHFPFTAPEQKELTTQFLIATKYLADSQRALDHVLNVDDEIQGRYTELLAKPELTKKEIKELSQIMTRLITTVNAYDLLLKQSIGEYVRLREDVDIALGTGVLSEDRARTTELTALHNRLSNLTAAFNGIVDEEKKMGIHGVDHSITPQAYDLEKNFGKSIASRMGYLFSLINHLSNEDQFLLKASLYLTLENYRFATEKHHESFKHISDAFTASLALYSFFLDAKLKSGAIPEGLVTQEMRQVVKSMRKTSEYERLVEEFDPQNERKLAEAEKSMGRWQTAANVVELVFPATTFAYYQFLQKPDASLGDKALYAGAAVFDAFCLVIMRGGAQLLFADARVIGTVVWGTGRAVVARTTQGLGRVTLGAAGATFRAGLFTWAYHEQFDSLTKILGSDDVSFEDKLFASLRFSRDVLVFEGMFLTASVAVRATGNAARATYELAKRKILEHYYANWLASQLGARAEMYTALIARTAQRLATYEITPNAAPAFVAAIREFGREAGANTLATFTSPLARKVFKEVSIFILAAAVHAVALSPSPPAVLKGSKIGQEYMGLPIQFSLTYDTDQYVRLRSEYRKLLRDIPSLEKQLSLYEFLELQAFKGSEFKETGTYVKTGFADYKMYLARNQGSHLSFGKFIVQKHLYESTDAQAHVTLDQWCTLSLLDTADESSYSSALARVLEANFDKNK